MWRYNITASFKFKNNLRHKSQHFLKRISSSFFEGFRRSLQTFKMQTKWSNFMDLMNTVLIFSISAFPYDILYGVFLKRYHEWRPRPATTKKWVIEFFTFDLFLIEIRLLKINMLILYTITCFLCKNQLPTVNSY